MDDVHWKDKFIVRIGGISIPEFKLLEIRFLTEIKYNLNILLDEFQVFDDALQVWAMALTHLSQLPKEIKTANDQLLASHDKTQV